MNDPNKAIDVNLSSLLSLKAELLRKQAEISKVKATRSTEEEYVARSNNYVSSNDFKEKKRLTAKEVNTKKNIVVYDHKDSSLLEKSQRVLAAKSKFYQRMSRTGGQLNSDDNCLVMFNHKRQENQSNIEDNESSSNSTDDADDGIDSKEEDWMEYTDCLGRTRKCLRKDLEQAKRRDVELAASMPERLDQSKANWMIDTKCEEYCDDIPIGPLLTESIYSDRCSMISKHDEQRANWERKEQENFEKANVHYQDVFFDEARQHGVGYYAFSTDEEERKRQQNELDEARQKTISEQKQRETMRAQREKIITERVHAARNRQRARQGLPPLEEKDTDIPKPEQQVESKNERRARKRAEKMQRKLEKVEKQRELERQQYVRPWDEEKDCVVGQSTQKPEMENEKSEWKYKPERMPMSQGEWNDLKRSEREPEFAPVCETAAFKAKRTYFSSMPQLASPPPIVLAYDVPYNMALPPISTQPDLDTFANFQTSKRIKQFHKRSYQGQNAEELVFPNGAAVSPPANFDAYDTRPPKAKQRKTHNELEHSIEAGLRFLREQSDKSTISTKSSWTSKTDY